jgi:hypothetical protein
MMSLKAMIVGTLVGTSALSPSVSPSARTPVAKAVVFVANHNVLDIDILVMVGSSKHRLGTVVTSQNQEFVLPDQAVGTGQVRMIAEPVGSREAFVSDPLTVNDGERVSLEVATHLPQSSVRVERRAR